MADQSHLMMSATAATADDDDLSTSSSTSSSSSLSGSSSSASEEAEFVTATPHEDDGDGDDDDAMEVVPDNDENDDSDEDRRTPPPAPTPAPSRPSSMSGSTKMRIKLRMSLTPKTKSPKRPSLPLKKAQKPTLPTKKKRPRSGADLSSSQLRNSSSSSGPVASVVCSTTAVDATAVVHSSSSEEEFDDPVTEAAVVPSSSSSANKKKTSSSKPQSRPEAPISSKKAKAGVASASTPSPAPSSASVTTSGASRSAVPSSQQSHVYHTRPVRIPPISSPGLLIPSGSPSSGGASAAGSSQGGANGTSGESTNNAFVTPTSVFDRAMSLAGYTTEGRASHPHRGSSVKRIVGDMFDSDAFMTLHFPELVPDHLLGPPRRPKKKGEENDEDTKTKNGDGMKNSIGKTPLPNILTDAISHIAKKQRQGGLNGHTAAIAPDNNGRWSRSSKRKSPLQFIDMVPKSLTTSYPESYVSKRVKYIQQVSAREAAIVASQEAADAAEDANELHEEAKEEWAVKVAAYESSRKDGAANGKNGEDGGPPPMPVPPPIPAPVHVPPIPTPPSLPTPPTANGIKSEADKLDDGASEAEGRQSVGTEMSEEEKKLSAPDNDATSNKEKESLFLDIPKDKKHLVSHLDPACFHVTTGRYVGLMCNSIADPQFVGPNAPGITGLNVSGGTGLATSYVGSSGGGGGGSSHSSSYYAGVSGVLSNQGSGGGGGGGSGKGSDGGSKKKSSSSSKSGSGSGGNATATSHELKRIMEQGGEEAERIRTSIIRAAVYASRSGNHGGTFVGANGETYPDVSKAFSMHGNMRPCNRCKSNKQGAYHCRLRRKHKEPDYDGGDSAGVLAPFFEEPLEDLLVAPARAASNIAKTTT